ncbi:MAG: TRAP transporter small permease [Hyphomicrobiaceae bacterium]
MDRFFNVVSSATGVVSTLICAALILTTTFSVVVYQRGITISWLDDLLRMLLIWLVFIGSVGPTWRRDHITMDALYTRLSLPLRRLVDIMVAAMGAVTCGFLAWMSAGSTWREYEFNTLLSSGEIPQWPQTLCIPLSFGFMTLAFIGVLITVLGGRNRSAPPETMPELN